MNATTRGLIDWLLSINCRLEKGAKHTKVFAPNGRMVLVLSPGHNTRDTDAIKRHILRKIQNDNARTNR